MPTAKYFEKIPAFPEDISVAAIPIISLAGLADDNSDTLFNACQAHGFFLLDLQGTADGEALLKDAETMFDLNTSLYALDEEVLLQHKFQPPGNLLG